MCENEPEGLFVNLQIEEPTFNTRKVLSIMDEPREEEMTDDDFYHFPDGSATLRIFPIEIWEAILEHVTSSKDLQNFGKAFPFWEDILDRTKQAWLFDQVFHHIWSYLARRDILTCRRVCKRWCSSVDIFLENNEFHRPADETGSHLRRRPIIRGLREIGLLYSPYNFSKMEKMYQTAINHPRNPIIGRSVYVDWERLWICMPFFLKFGKYIWYMRIQCVQRDVDPIPFLLRILGYLPHFPNLRKLELSLGEGLTEVRGVFNSSHDLDVYLRQCPIAQITCLETLDLDIMGHLHGKVKDVLLTTFAHQIRRLSINRFALCTSLPYLTDLSVTLDSNHQLESLLELKSPLTRLVLSVVDHANYPLTFKAIQHFAPTIRALTVEFPTATSFSPMDWRQLKSPAFQLPSLKTLILKGCIPPSLNFICGLQSLQYMHIYDLRSSELVALLDNQTNFEEETVQILRYLNQPSQFQTRGCMYKSNLWEVFPKLREYTFTSFTRRTPNVERCYRRDHYDKIMRWRKVEEVTV